MSHKSYDSMSKYYPKRQFRTEMALIFRANIFGQPKNPPLVIKYSWVQSECATSDKSYNAASQKQFLVKYEPQ